MKTNYFSYYAFYNNTSIRILRILVLIGLTCLVYFFRDQFLAFRFLLFIYTAYLVNEIFIRFGVNCAFPTQTVASSANPKDSLLFSVRKVFMGRKDIVGGLIHLSHKNDVAFLIGKIGGYNFVPVEIDEAVLYKKALELSQQANGSYITGADIFTAFLVLSEPSTHALQDRELTENDVFEILLWAREKFQTDVKKQHRLHFTGYGVFDFFVYGWNTMLKEYSFDITYSVVGKNAIPIVGREKEFEALVSILSKNSVNNAIIIGESGVGKSSLVLRLALEAYRDTRFILHNMTVYELLVDRVLAGVQNAGELEERLGLLFAEVGHIGNAVLFIQNIENIFGAGGYGFDMSGVLFEYLKNGNIQVIGSTTPAFYKTVIQKKSSILTLFEEIRLEEPDRPTLLKMIVAHVDKTEEEYHIAVSYQAIHETIELSSSFLPDEFLPGKAINLLQDAASRVRLEGRGIVEKEDVTKIVQDKTHIVLEKPTIDEKKVLLSLEDDLHKRVIGQNEAVGAVSQSIRRLRSGFSQHKRPISVFLFLGPTGVGKTETAKALAALYFGSEDAMIRLDMSEYQTQNEVERLLGGLPGGVELESSLPEEVRLHPFSLILLDEFEKAHPHILDIFLQVFEDGRLTDNQGKTVSFKNTIIIATSNAGSEEIRELIHAGKTNAVMKEILVEGLLKEGVFKPELLNRFDDVIVFKPLTVAEAGQIAKLILAESLKTLEDEQIYISYDEKAIQKIVNESYDQEAGARNMRRYVGSTVEDFISKLILEDKLIKGAKVTLSVDESNNFILQ